MQPFNYHFFFEDLSSAPSPVHMTSPKRNDPSIFFAEVNDRQFLTQLQQTVPAHLADGIDIAIAVAIADRLSLRKGEQTCRIHLSIPVRHPEHFKQPALIQHLQDVLYWYTQDYWSLDFRPRTRYGREAERQNCLPFPTTRTGPLEVALWSGGLDSLAGLYTRLSSNSSTHHILFGTGMNTQIHQKQAGCAHCIAHQFSERTTLVQVPYRLHETKGMPKHTLQRTRGFVFLLLGAICALLEKQHVLHIYENGIGALNLPFCEAEVGLDHSLSVHPLSLLRMEALVSDLFRETFTFTNPFLFQTKAQMCAALNDSPLVKELILATFTCDRPHRDYPLQCGYCSSCLLRRQALATAMAIEDPTSYVLLELLKQGRSIRPSYRHYFHAMDIQVASLRTYLATKDPWAQLCADNRYISLLETTDELAKAHNVSKEVLSTQFLHLYKQYVQEWEQVYLQIGRGLLGEHTMLLPEKPVSEGA